MERSENPTAPHFDGGASVRTSRSDSALEKRLTGQARARMGELALLTFAVTLLFLPLFGFVLFGFRNPVMTRELALIGLTGMSLDAALFLAARDRGLEDAQVVRFGLVHHVLRVAVVGLSARLTMMLGHVPNAITVGHGLIILFALFVPLSPARRIVVAVLAAATQPVILIALAPRAVPVDSLVNSWGASCIVALIAAFCGQVTFALRSRAAQGDELGAYHLVELLGRDRSGEVWRGTHRLLARPAAIRIIQSPLLHRSAEREALRAFEEQAHAAACLTSPHTETLYDYGVSEEGALYCVFELLEGESAFERIARAGPLSVAEAGRIAREVCDSLQEAHASGLVHGDLSPQHVLLCHIGRDPEFVKVVGFGITDSFLPLDVRRSAPRDAAGDIRQLGRLLSFLLTGNTQVEASALGARGVPVDLQSIVQSCTTSDSSARFPSVRELAVALRASASEQLPEGGPSSVSPLPGAERPLVELRSDQPAEHDPSGRTYRARERPGAASSSGSEVFLRTAAPDFGWKGIGQQVLKAPRQVSPEMLDAARRRLQKLSLVLAGLSALLFGGSLAYPEMRTARTLEEVVPTIVLALSLDLALYFMARDRRLSTGAVMNAALGYFVLRAAVLSFSTVRAYLALGLELPLTTFAQILVLVLPLFVPKSPKQLFFPLFLVAAATPLALYLLTPPDYPPVWGTAAVRSGASLFLGMFVAHFVNGLHLSASRVRAFGSYRLVQIVGRGGMGEVWKAEHDLLARPAAIKLVSIRKASPQMIAARERRFAREARTTALLSSPHTVTLYDYGVSDDGRFYAVMELLEGEDLQRRVERQGPLTARQTVRVALQACDSLAEAHARGLVHRDLKPANLFMAKIGCDPSFVKVLDFGFAELTQRLRFSSEASTVATVRVAGTPAYMAPEALLERTVDGRADIYQLGCVLYFLLTGRVVFECPSVAALAIAHINQVPEPASRWAPAPVPEDLERIVLRCLRKEPAHRFSEIAELEDALRRVRFDALVGDRRGAGANRDPGEWLGV